MLAALNVMAQNCDVDFPGTATRTFSGSCGGPTVNNLELGISFNLSDGDTFTFDIPVVNITGNLHIDVDGNGKIIIPAGVTLNVGGNVQIHNKNSNCTPTNPCVFEIVVNGNANFNKDLDNDVFTLVWSGTGTVTAITATTAVLTPTPRITTITVHRHGAARPFTAIAAPTVRAPVTVTRSAPIARPA